MDDLLLSVLEDTDFLKPYIKQFSKYFNQDSKLVEISPKSNKYIEYLKELNINIEEYNNQNNIDGILLINTNEYIDKTEELFEIINNILKEEGYIFFRIRNKNYLLEKIEYHLLNNYKLVEEFINDDNWNFLLYQKSTIK